MSITSVMGVVTLRDFDGGVAWYERLFGRPPDARPMDGLADIAAADVIEGMIAWITSVEDPEGNGITFAEPLE